jgi:hypothetical protein
MRTGRVGDPPRHRLRSPAGTILHSVAIVTWIETKYNRRRRQRALASSPVEFEMNYTTADAA